MIVGGALEETYPLPSSMTIEFSGILAAMWDTEFCKT